MEFTRDPNNTRSGLYSMCRLCKNRVQRLAVQRSTLKQREATREYQRFWKEAKRRKAGVPVRTFHRRHWVGEKGGAVRLDREPIVEAMERYVRAQRMNGHPDFGWSDLAVLVGTTERTLLRYRSGESNRIVLDSADRIAVAIGVPLAILYPLDEEVS